MGWTLMSLIGCNLVRLSMQSKHYSWKINFYLALCPLTYHLRRVRVMRRKVLDKNRVLYRPLTTNSIMERGNHGVQGNALVTEVDEEDTGKEALWREMENLYQLLLNFCQDLRQEVGERHQVCLRLERRAMDEVHRMEGHLVRLEGLIAALEE